MKKIFLTLTLALAAVAAGAQTMYDALYFGENEYLGSARSISLGNAVTALGGDLGMAGINPAAPAVAGYNQFIITPSLSISSIVSSYAPVQGGSYGGSQRTNSTRFALPNVGVSTLFPTGNLDGLRSVTFTVAANSTGNYNGFMDNVGINSQTSKFAEFATAADGIDLNYLTYGNYPGMWDVVNAFESGTMSAYAPGKYMGSSEYLVSDKSYHYLPGQMTQTNKVEKFGTKTDLVFGLSFNVSDQFYWGINMGVPIIEYDYRQSYKEVAMDPNQFPAVMVDTKTQKSETTYYDYGLYQYSYSSRISGLYGKIGFIALPTSFIRIGAAIQTPVAYSVAESWEYSGQVAYMNTKYSTKRTYSPVSENRYSYRGPWEINVGAAIVFGTAGLLSVDYEMTDFSHMRIGNPSGSQDIAAANSAIGNFCGVSHSLRAGIEVNLNNWWALRFGGGFVTDPEKSRLTSDGHVITSSEFTKDYQSFLGGRKQLGSSSYSNPLTGNVSAGLGYASDSGIFVDFSVKVTMRPSYTFNPYYSYNNVDRNGREVNVLSPAIKCTQTLWNAALTFGWRF